MAKRKLNAKQILFAEEYLVDLNGAQAAIRAGYTKKTARITASKLLTNSNILKYIQEQQAKRCTRTKVNADWVLDRLAKIAEGSLGDFIVIPEDGSPPYYDFRKATPEQLRLMETCQIDTTQIGKLKTTKIKVGLASQLKALELIGKHVDVKAFQERVEHTGKVTLSFDEQDSEA